MPYPRRATQLHGYGVIPVAAVPIATSVIKSLFGPKRLASGVKQSVYNDEVNRINAAAAQGSAALQLFLNNTMLGPSQAPWGTLFSPEAITYARAKLASLPAPTPQAVDTVSAVSAAIGEQIAAGNIPPATAQAIAQAAGRVQTAAQTATVTGGIRQLTGMNPMVLLAAVGVGAFLLTRRK